MEDKTENYDAVAADIFAGLDISKFSPLSNVNKFSTGFNAGVSYASGYFSQQIDSLKKQLAAIVEDRDRNQNDYEEMINQNY